MEKICCKKPNFRKNLLAPTQCTSLSRQFVQLVRKKPSCLSLGITIWPWAFLPVEFFKGHRSYLLHLCDFSKVSVFGPSSHSTLRHVCPLLVQRVAGPCQLPPGHGADWSVLLLSILQEFGAISCSRSPLSITWGSHFSFSGA